MTLGVMVIMSVVGQSAIPLAFKAVCDPGDSQSCIQPLLQGEPAPFMGQLLTMRRAVLLGQAAQACDTRVKLEGDRVHELAAIDLGLCERLREQEGEAWDEKLTFCGEQLAAAKRHPWWESRFLVATVSVALTAVAFLFAN